MRIIWWIVIAVAVIVVALGGYWYYEHSLRYPSTDDAYVKAHVINIAAQVSGQLTAVPVDDQQLVHKGELLLRIDPRPFRLKLIQAKAKRALAKQQVDADKANINAATAKISSIKATLENDRLRYHRLKRLRAHNSVSQSDLDDAAAALKSARASLKLAQAQRQQAQAQLGKSGNDNANVRQAEADVRMSKLNLNYTTVRAPCDGRVDNLTSRPGDVIQSGQSMFALVCTHQFWVYANYKETDLARIRPGQKATISVDTYPDHVFHGVVENIAPASGAAFSLLPPENATGNWVKVTQRVPVRVRITDASDRYPLRVQTSTTVTIDTGPRQRPAGGQYPAEAQLSAGTPSN